MSPRGTVRTHTRTGKDGVKVVVTQHTRTNRTPTSRRGKRNALKAFRAARRGKKQLALKLAGLAFVEIAAWAVLQGAVLMITTFILVLVGTLVLVLGGAPKRRRRRRRVVKR